jgi:phage recombination protein Bet
LKEKQMTTDLAKMSPLQLMADRCKYDPEQMERVLMGTVIRPGKNGSASPEEVVAFCIVANELGLNPLKKEIYAFPNKGTIVPVVSIDGWCNIVHRKKGFNGVSFEENEKDGKLVSTTCAMHVKGLDMPVMVTERLDECVRPTEPWKTMPRRMLRHKSFIQAARIAFSMGGIYDEDEGKEVFEREVDVTVLSKPKAVVEQAPAKPAAPPVPPAPAPTPTRGFISEAQVKRLWSIAKGAGVSNAIVKKHLTTQYGIESSKGIPRELYEEICAWCECKPPPETQG